MSQSAQCRSEEKRQTAAVEPVPLPASPLKGEEIGLASPSSGEGSSSRGFEQHPLRFAQLLALARDPGLLDGVLLVAAHALGDLRQVAPA